MSISVSNHSSALQTKLRVRIRRDLIFHGSSASAQIFQLNGMREQSYMSTVRTSTSTSLNKLFLKISFLTVLMLSQPFKTSKIQQGLFKILEHHIGLQSCALLMLLLDGQKMARVQLFFSLLKRYILMPQMIVTSNNQLIPKMLRLKPLKGNKKLVME